MLCVYMCVAYLCVYMLRGCVRVRSCVHVCMFRVCSSVHVCMCVCVCCVCVCGMSNEKHRGGRIPEVILSGTLN